MRRLNISGGTLSLMDYCTAGPQYASGGFIADSRLPDTINGSQQQWLTRNSEVDELVQRRVEPGLRRRRRRARTTRRSPTPPYTTLETTPVSREKPYLFVDGRGPLQRPRARRAQRDTRGITWADGHDAGPHHPAARLLRRQAVRLGAASSTASSPGASTCCSPRACTTSPAASRSSGANTVVLGIGHATLTAVNGATPLDVADVPGVVVAGVTIDAGLDESPVLLRVGTQARPRREHARATRPRCPTCTSASAGRTSARPNIALEVNSDNVLIDHTWVWRGDHGVEGFTDHTERWNTNTGRYGAVINGDNVTATGLFVEHFQRYNTVWNGEHGTTILYQNELPYDPPTQADWMNGDVEGWAGYKVGDRVRHHTLYGGGVYVFNQNNPSIHTENGFEVPERPGVRLHHIMTVNLSAGTIDHVVNGVGGPADTTGIGVPVYIADYPAPYRRNRYSVGRGHGRGPRRRPTSRRRAG